MRVNEVSYVKI